MISIKLKIQELNLIMNSLEHSLENISAKNHTGQYDKSIKWTKILLGKLRVEKENYIKVILSKNKKESN